MKTLHILNGDATVSSFRESGLPSDVIIWREILSEGPVKANVFINDELWAIRRKWLAEHVDGRAGDYEAKVVAEFDKLPTYASYDEVVLWFEHDLNCQINLVFLLTYFARVPIGQVKLKQIVVGAHVEISPFKGLGQLNGAQMATLYLQAEELTDHELHTAVRVWKAYAGDEPGRVQELLNGDFGRLRFLSAALKWHLQRFPFTDNGLNLIELQLLTILLEGPMPETKLIRRFLDQDEVYGVSDWIVGQYLRQWDGQLWLRSNGEIELIEKGTDIAAARQSHSPVDRWLGGYHQTAESRYRWDTDSEQLVRLR